MQVSAAPKPSLAPMMYSRPSGVFHQFMLWPGNSCSVSRILMLSRFEMSTMRAVEGSMFVVGSPFWFAPYHTLPSRLSSDECEYCRGISGCVAPSQALGTSCGYPDCLFISQVHSLTVQVSDFSRSST